MSDLRLSLLGAPRLEHVGKPVVIELRKAMALLIYLAVTEQRHSRDALATLFWPELDQSRARAGLRYALSALKKSMGKDWADKEYPLAVDREAVGLNRSAEIWLDVVEFQDRLAECRTHDHANDQVCPACLPPLAAAAALYRDDFLAGFTLRDSPGFDEWQFFQTEGLRDELARVLERLVDGHSAQGQYEPAIAHARRWLVLDPVHEPVHRHLMRLYSWSGQRAAALRQYSECERILLEELGAPPEDDTTRLYRAIKEKHPPSPPGKPATAPIAPRAVDLNERYHLGPELGRGDMGVTYRARDISLERDVAVKVIPVESAGQERDWLIREAQATVQLSHPNIASVYDVGESGDALFIVMELVRGESLHARTVSGKLQPENLDEIISIARQVCAALDHAHAHDIVHRDLRPESVLLAPDGTARLVGFSLARPLASRMTGEGTVAGTVFYLAPELALGQAFDGRADLYGLGVMLYELTTGRLPFTAGDPMAVISQHLDAPVVPPRARNAEIPPALDALVVRLLSKDPGERVASAAEVLQVLDAADFLDQGTASGELSVLKRIGRGRLVGRDREIQEARTLWSRALSGRGQVLLVSGEAGIGKTRLARELVTQARVSGGRALAGASYAEGGMPFEPFRQIIRQVFRSGFLGSGQDSLALPEFVLVDLLMLAPELRSRYDSVPDSSPTSAYGTRPVPGLPADPQAEQQRLFENLTIFFTALSEQLPLLLVFEDVHWADSGTLSLLRHLARHTRRGRVMIVATYRQVEPEEASALHEVLLDLHRDRLARQLKLPRLDRQQTEEMLAALFAQEVPPEFLERIYGATEGNPFYTEEVCKTLVDSGKVYFQNGRWLGPSIKEVGIPHSVRVAILQRVNALPPDAQATLRLAAVLGREFDFETLAYASAPDGAGYGDQDALIEALESAERAQLIEELHGERGEIFAFVHALIPTTLVESTRALQRRRLHRRAAAAIEARHPENFEALAHHYSQAGDTRRAANHLLQAGDRARGLYAHQEAIASYQQALDLLKAADDLERAARTLMKLGLTYHSAFNFEAARQAYQEGFDLWQRVADAQREPADLPSPPHALRVTAVEPFSVIPGVAMDLPSGVMSDQLFSGLVEVSPDMSVVPDVAHSWEVLDGGRRYVFHLRGDAVWSDGVAVTAGDFEYSLKRTLTPGRQWRAQELLYDIRGARAFHQGQAATPNEVGVRALDERTLVIDLEEPAGYFLYILAFSPLFPLPRHVVQAKGATWEDPEHIVTNGPFRLASWVRGESIVLERNPTYHRWFPGNLQRVECSFLSGQAGQFLEMYDQDLLDLYGDLPPAEMNRARQRYAGEYVSGPRLSLDFLGFDVRRPPFDDRRVRRAFALATDRETLADVALRGYAFPATGGFVPPGMPGHSPGIGLAYDPQRARRLLAEAGYPDGRDFPAIACLARDDPGHDLMREYLGAQWRKVLGVDVDWEEIEWGRFPNRMSEATPHMWMVGYWADYPDPDDYLRVLFWLPPGWQHPRYSELVEDARRALDHKERMRLYQRADKILTEETPVLPLCYARFHVLVKPWVRNYLTAPLRWWYWKHVILEPH